MPIHLGGDVLVRDLDMRDEYNHLHILRPRLTRFIPSRVLVTRQASARAYIAVSSSKGTDLCMKWMGMNSTVPNRPLMRPTSSLTHARRFWYSSTSWRDGMASWTRTTWAKGV